MQKLYIFLAISLGCLLEKICILNDRFTRYYIYQRRSHDDMVTFYSLYRICKQYEPSYQGEVVVA